MEQPMVPVSSPRILEGLGGPWLIEQERMGSKEEKVEEKNPGWSVAAGMKPWALALEHESPCLTLP